MSAKEPVMKKIELKHGKANSSVIVLPYGATITSWSVDGEEYIFVSNKAIMDGSKGTTYIDCICADIIRGSLRSQNACNGRAAPINLF